MTVSCLRTLVNARVVICVMVALLMIIGVQTAVEANAITVTKTDDTDGTCEIDDCSLREAIEAASNGDTISIPAGTHTLKLAQLSINKELTLIGAGADKTIVRRASGLHRVFQIGSSAEVIISGVAIKNGIEAYYGGGIHNTGMLTLADCIVSQNVVYGADGDGYGGGIYSHGILTLVNSTVIDNTASHYGGGVHVNYGETTLRNSVVMRNTADYGGGISNLHTLTLLDSTISENRAIVRGGGIENSLYLGIINSVVNGTESLEYGGGIWNSGIANLTNTTASGNHSVKGGGIYNHAGTLTLTNGTVNANHASSDGGGISNNTGATLELVNTLIAGNEAPTGLDCFGLLTSLGHNLIGSDINCGFAKIGSDLVGTPLSPIDPLLGPLQDNGGPTLTHALLPGSLAIDAGDDERSPETDQRGVTRPIGSASDIGSYEAGSATNKAPIAGDDIYSMYEGRTIVVPAPGVLDNDVDIEDDPLTVVLTSDVDNGTLALSADGSFTYTPDLGFTGTDTFSYKASDGEKESDEATVTVVVIPEGVVLVEPVAPSTVPSGIEFQVEVKASNVYNLAGAQITLTHEPSSLSFVSAQPGDEFAICESDAFSDSPGTVNLAFACGTGHSSPSLVLWTVTFGVGVVSERTETQMTVTDVVLANAQVPPQPITGDGTSTTITLLIGVCGDQNDDGIADILDVVIDLQVAVGLVAPTSVQAILSDLNRDGTVDVLDAIMGLQHIVGRIPRLDECGPM